MAEAKKNVNSKQLTADSKTDEKLSSISRKPSAKADLKEVSDGDIKESSKVETEANSQAEVVKTAKAGLPVAKAGKRSEKAIKETEAKQAKEERKAKSSEALAKEESKPKIHQKPAKSVLERKGKKFRKLAELIEPGKSYSLKDAVDLATKSSPVKFDATVELHARLGVDPRQADQNLRDTIVLPAGTGKTVRVAVFADLGGVTAAKKAGADIAAGDEFLQILDTGVIDFDILVSTPAFMSKLGKYARLLGPKGLMPNPKSGTVTNDVAKAVTESKAGRLEYRVDSTGIIHVGVGKVSFGSEKLLQNVQAVMTSIKNNKPSSLKSTYIVSVFITTSMGPSIPVDLTELN